MKKKILFAVLLASMALAAGCSKDGDNDASGNTAAESGAEGNEDSTSVDGMISVADAETEIYDLELDEVIEVTAYESTDFVTLGDYKGIEIPIMSTEATDEELEAEIEYTLQNNGYTEEVTDRTVENGDLVDIDYEGFKDDVAFDGGAGQNFQLEIGSNSFIDGFEEGLIGAEVGKMVDLELTFPDPYERNEELSGADVVFKVTVNAIVETMELTDEIVQELSETDKTVEEYKKTVKAGLDEDKVQDADNTQRQILWSQVTENAEIKGYPESALRSMVQEQKRYYSDYAEYAGMDMEEFAQYFFGMEGEEFLEYYNQQSRGLLGEEMIMEVIAKEEGLELSDEEYQESLESYFPESGYDTIEEFESISGKNLRRQLLFNIVMEKLLDEAVEVEY